MHGFARFLSDFSFLKMYRAGLKRVKMSGCWMEIHRALYKWVWRVKVLDVFLGNLEIFWKYILRDAENTASKLAGYTREGGF
jgi:hypothetical protein